MRDSVRQADGDTPALRVIPKLVWIFVVRWRILRRVDGAASVLIVDDDPDIRALVKLTLETERDFTIDLTCAEAADGFHAFEMWQEGHYDVVVLDQRMPGMSGIDVARTLLELEPDQVVILFSANLDSRTIEAAERLGVHASLSKLELRSLPRTIEEALV